MFSTASFWNSYCGDRCDYLQVSVRSHHSFGLSLLWISSCIFCSWAGLCFLPLQRKIHSLQRFIPKHHLHYLLQHYPVSIIFSHPLWIFLHFHFSHVVMKPCHRGLVGMAAAFVLWPTLTELHHWVHNLHDNLKKECPTAKTGLIGGGGVLSFCLSLFWTISLMLTDNVREDYFEEMDPQGGYGYGQVTTTQVWREDKKASFIILGYQLLD